VITLEINRHLPLVQYKTHGKPKVVAGSELHMRGIHAGLCRNVTSDPKFECGNEFRAKGKKGKGVLIGYQERFEEAEWDGMKCKLIELWFAEDNDFGLFHPSDLKGPC
jgi:hypothetical protein